VSRYEVEKRKWDEFAGRLRGVYGRKREGFTVTETYEGVFGRLNTLRPVVGHLDLGAGPKTVLDIGCGAGWTTKLLAQKARVVVGVDVSFESVRLAAAIARHNRLDNVHVLVADGDRLPFRDGAFDCVFGHAILHHLELDEALGQVSRLLKPGGRAAFAEPLSQNRLARAARVLKQRALSRHPGTDRPLTYRDRATFEKHFRRVAVVETGFVGGRIRALGPWESRLLARFPFLRSTATQACFLLEK